MREIVLAGVHYQIVGDIIRRSIKPWKPALRGTGSIQYSDFSEAEMEEYHDFRNGIGLQSDIAGQTARNWWGEGVDVSTARSAVLGPLITTAGSFGVAPVKILDFQSVTYAIGDNAIRKWNKDTSNWDYADPYLIENCEDAWNESVHGDVVSTLDTDIEKAGSGCAKLDIDADISNGDVLATEEITSIDLSGAEKVVLWVRCTKARESGDLALLLDDTANCPATPLEVISIPALVANTWTQCTLTLANPSTDTAIISVGMEFNAHAEECDIHIDDIRATFPDPIDAIVVTDETDEYLIVSSATESYYTTDGTTWTAMNNWPSPTGSTAGNWSNATNAYDDDTDSDATRLIGHPPEWSGYLLLTIAAQSCASIRYFVGTDTHADITKIDVDVYYGGAWHDLYEGAFTKGEWITKDISGGPFAVTQARIQFWNSSDVSDRTAALAEFDFACAPAGYMADYDNRLYWIKTNGSLIGYSTAKDIDDYGDIFSLTGNFGTLYDFFEGKLLSDGSPTLYFCGTKGIYSLDTSTELAYKQEIGYPPLTYAGHCGLYWNANLWQATGYGILKITPSMAVQVGPDQDDGLPSSYQGYIYDMATVGNWLVYCVNGGSTDKSSILKRNASVGGNIQVYTTSAVDKAIACLHHSPSSLYTNGRLWFGEKTDVKYMMFPDTTSNVKQVSTYQYVNDSDYFELPIFRKLAAINKVALGVAAITKSCDDSDYINLYYGLNGAAPTNAVGTGYFKTSPRPTILTFGSGLGTEFYRIQFAYKLIRGDTNTNSPELESLMFYWYPVITTLSAWTFRVEAIGEWADWTFTQFEAIRDTATLVVFYRSGDEAKTSYNVKLTQMPSREWFEEMGGREGSFQVELQEVFKG